MNGRTRLWKSYGGKRLTDADDGRPTQARTFLTLDGLRGAAALSVLVMHEPHHGAFQLPHAYLAVDLFFAMSGFIMSHAYERRLAVGLSPWRLLVIRWIRLAPLFLLGLVLGALVTVVASDGAVDPVKMAAGLAAGLLFLPSEFGAGPLFPFNIPAWSLFVEMAVNVVFAFVAPRLKPPVLWAVIGAGALAVLASSLAHGGSNGGWSLANLPEGLVRVWFSFFLGMGLHRLWRTDAFPRLRLPTAGLFIAILAVFAVPSTSSALNGWFDAVAIVLVFPVVLLAAVRTVPPAWLAPTFAGLGLLSYPVYILQSAVLGFLTTAGDRLVRPGWIEKGAFGLVVLTIGVIAVSALAAVAYDAPVRAWLTRLSRRPAPSETVTAPPPPW